MLTTEVQSDVPKDPPLLAVDSTGSPPWRPGRIGDCPRHGGCCAGARCGQDDPVITGTQVPDQRRRRRNFDPAVDFRLRVQVVPLDGGDPTSLDMGGLQDGRRRLTRRRTSTCARTAAGSPAIGVTTGSPSGLGATITIEGMRTLAPTAGRRRSAARRRRTTGSPRTRPPATRPAGQSGCRRTHHDGRRQPPDDLLGARVGIGAVHIPVVSTVHLPRGIAGQRQQDLPCRSRWRSASPRCRGTAITGALIDLANFDAVSGADSNAYNPQVWLNDQAPADIVAKLRTHGV